MMIWQWMDGLVTRQAITQELEAYKQAGIAGVQNFQIGGKDQTLVGDSSNAIGTEAWKKLMRFAMDECSRLGLTFGTHNCPGWSSSGYPTVRVENSMQKLVWSETRLQGGRRVSLALPRPKVDPRWNYYEDIVVLAFPKLPAVQPDEIVDVTSFTDSLGVLRWKAPRGEWTILRMGHTTTGKTNSATAPESGTGLECDKMSRHAVDAFWEGYPTMLLGLRPELNGSTFNLMEIDSYEAGPQNWTKDMCAEFLRRRGYDLRKWLPVLAGKTVGSEDMSRRFRHDFQETITDLYAENYYAYMAEKVSQHPGMRLLIQPYGPTIDTQKVSASGQFMLSGEFWTHPGNWGWNTLEQMSSAAHTTGHRVLVGEAFTCWPVDAWGDDPYSLKSVADLAYCGGINRFMLHAATVNPWNNVQPGMTFGKWGTQFTEQQTWWQMGAKPLFSYFARCQALLQRGQPVADICFLQGKNKRATPMGFSSDLLGERAFVNCMTVSGHQLVLPHGMTYSLLVLPKEGSVSIETARKILRLVESGARIYGPRFKDVTGLCHLEENRKELADIVHRLWPDSASVHHVGKGLVIENMSLASALRAIGTHEDLKAERNGLQWTHRRDNGTDIYFLANTLPASVTQRVSLRGRKGAPQLWHPDTGKTETAASWDYQNDCTLVDITLDPHGSVFIIANDSAAPAAPGFRPVEIKPIDSLTVQQPWTLTFQPGRGAPASVKMMTLTPWNESEDNGVKYFSGTATYTTAFICPRRFLKGQSCWLSLGNVKNCAVVIINGHRCEALWKPPFKVDVTPWLQKGKNSLRIEVTNLWKNRMIGDEFEKDDVEWSDMLYYSYAPGNPPIGRFMKSIPDWLRLGKPRPSKHRYTLSSFKFFTTQTPLAPSGLMGPVRLLVYNK